VTSAESILITEPQFFDLKTPYLEQGRSRKNVAKTDLLNVVGMVYAAGGENAMHHHRNEDHVFVILEGEATFHIESDDNIKVVGRYEGVMLPQGANYWFTSTGTDNLVMLRVGGKYGRITRAFPDGSDFAGDSEENKEVEMIERPGKGFGV
jgi:mannose-6-phosphate isomerase-like protein (cupin superfamily)